jgi:4'-phosphopantetheinyl transferase
LEGAEVHVWRATLDQSPAAVRELFDVLAPDERQRAGRFHFQSDRDHFVVARGALREILSSYLGVRPGQLSFSCNPYGKPELDASWGVEDLRFNVSHSHGLALYALTRGRPVGVDIEFVRDDLDGLELAERFFSSAEGATLRAVPDGSRAEAFFNCWTRKEAYIKAVGEGLSHPLKRFTVSLAPGEPAALLRTDGDPHEPARWSLIELFPGRGYVAALAVKGRGLTLRQWQWRGGGEWVGTPAEAV